MIRIVLPSVFVVSALALVGCASGTQAATHANDVSVAHLRSAQIPGDMFELDYDDAHAAAPQSGEHAAPLRANTSERPSKGAVHAAHE